ncbi:hypothetical protein SUGI_0267840 [Cryptomeria japonica]|nr:hypothetical protein SUGI_0267840 [Cryptomeria japonica]
MLGSYFPHEQVLLFSACVGSFYSPLFAAGGAGVRESASIGCNIGDGEEGDSSEASDKGDAPPLPSSVINALALILWMACWGLRGFGTMFFGLHGSCWLRGKLCYLASS